MSVAIETLRAARNVDFKPVIFAEYLGGALPLEGASASMQVRQYPGEAGDPLAAASSVGLSDAATPTDAEPTLRTLTIEPVILRADLAALPGQNQPEAGDAQTFFYEIKLTYGDDEQDSLLIGQFILSAGVDDT